MERNMLGNTGIEVSRLCFGALIIGPLQRNMTPEEGGRVIRHALEQGVNFIDTAELYGTYAHIREALRGFSGDVVISTKSYAWNRETAVKAVEEARMALDRDVLDIFMMHEQESEYTFAGHHEAWETYQAYQQRGVIRALGISTHHVAAVKAACARPDMQVVHPIFNRAGLGIVDGTIEEMQAAVRQAHSLGKGIFGMKALGGGNLIGGYEEAIRFVLEEPSLHAIAMGMQSLAEADKNIARFEGRHVPEETERQLNLQPRRLRIQSWCEGCGRCVSRCQQQALRLENGMAVVNARCVCCGYCSAECPCFAIKID